MNKSIVASSLGVATLLGMVIFLGFLCEWCQAAPVIGSGWVVIGVISTIVTILAYLTN